MPTTLLDVLRLSTRYLADRGSGSPRLDAELITAHALGLRRIDVYLQHDRPLREDELVPLRDLVRRRGQGEPVAYLVGEREFFGRAFRVTRDVLIPRPETETLVELVLAWARGRAGTAGEGLRIADAGTGSGCIAVTLAAELPGAHLLAGDVSPAALAVARENAARHGVAERVDIREGAWCAPFADGDPLDGVVSNPPYIATAEMDGLMADVRGHEPHLALEGGADGLAAYRILVPAAAALVRDVGALFLEIDERRAGAVAALAGAALHGAAVTIHKDLAGRDRVVQALRG